MNEKQFDLVVVSVFGRGQWLANEFATRGWRVELLDVTDQLGSFDHRDVEGPFGLLEGQNLHPSQRARLVDEGEFVSVASGFTLWLNEGPLELRSELTPFHLRARDIPFEVESYLRLPDQNSVDARSERRGLKKLRYAHSWLAQFAHAVSAGSHRENYIALDSQAASPLFTPYGLRQLTANGIAKGLQASQSVGVNVRPNASIQEIRLDGAIATTVSYTTAAGTPTVDQARAFVWCLSFDETKKISDALVRTLFPQNWPDAPWSWQRVSFEAKPSDMLSMIPLAVAVIEDVDLAWTRANLILLRRREGESRFDAWMKVPSWMRRETASFEQVRDEARLNLEKRFPGVKLEVVKEEMTPLLWPMWAQDEFGEMQKRAAPIGSPNLFFSMPGVWASLDWLGRFRHEDEIALKLEKLKTQWDAAARKLEAAAQRQKQRSQS